MTKRHAAKYKTRPPYGRKRLGPPEKPRQSPRIRPRPARPAPQRQALRLRRAAARQAEAEGATTPTFRERQFRGIYAESHPPEGRFGANLIGLLERRARHHRLSCEVRADDVRRPPVRQPRPRQGQRQARQHFLDAPSRSATSSKCEEASTQLALVLEARTSSPSATCRIMSRPTTAR